MRATRISLKLYFAAVIIALNVLASYGPHYGKARVTRAQAVVVFPPLRRKSEECAADALQENALGPYLWMRLPVMS